MRRDHNYITINLIVSLPITTNLVGGSYSSHFKEEETETVIVNNLTTGRSLVEVALTPVFRPGALPTLHSTAKGMKSDQGPSIS